jgi:hypothetical protein
LKKLDGTPANITFPILWDLKDIVKNKYGIKAIPDHVLIDKNNKIIFEYKGFDRDLKLNKLDAKLAELMP